MEKLRETQLEDAKEKTMKVKSQAQDLQERISELERTQSQLEK